MSASHVMPSSPFRHAFRQKGLTAYSAPGSGWRVTLCGWRVEWESQRRTVASRRSRRLSHLFAPLCALLRAPRCPGKPYRLAATFYGHGPLGTGFRLAGRAAVGGSLCGARAGATRGAGGDVLGVELATVGALVGFGGALHAHLAAHRGILPRLRGGLTWEAERPPSPPPCGRCGLSRVGADRSSAAL
eukprot:4174517-Prymnesium_polylepis.1